MKHFSYRSFLFLLILTIQNQTYAQEGWVNFMPDAVLKFTVDVPNEMKFETKEITTVIGKLTTQTYSIEGVDEDPNYLYLINVVEYPPGTFPADSIALIEDYLISSIHTTVEKLKGELVYSSETEDGENGRGKLYRIKHNDDQLVLKGKSFIKKDVFINIQVFTIKDKSLNNEMNYFLDSFKARF